MRVALVVMPMGAGSGEDAGGGSTDSASEGWYSDLVQEEGVKRIQELREHDLLENTH